MLQPFNCKECLKQFGSMAEYTIHKYECEPVSGREAREKVIKERNAKSEEQ